LDKKKRSMGQIFPGAKVRFEEPRVKTGQLDSLRSGMSHWARKGERERNQMKTVTCTTRRGGGVRGYG